MPTTALPFLMARVLKPSADSVAHDERTSNETVEAVLQNGLYQIQGVAIPASGTAQLQVGDVVPVKWRDGRPVVILAHNARRAPAVRRLAGSAPAIEELVQTGGVTYFRNDQQLTALTAVAEVLTTTRTVDFVPTVTYTIPGQLVWGERDDTFCVVADLPISDDGPAGIRYFVFKLNRAEGEVLGSTKATATLLDTLLPPDPPIELPDTYDSVANVYSNEFIPAPGRYLTVACAHATFPAPLTLQASDPVYLSRGLDVLMAVTITAESTFAFDVLGLITGRRLGLTQWLKVFSFTRQEFIWESPVSAVAEALVKFDDCGSFDGPFDNDALLAVKDEWLPGPETDFSITSGRILAWDERDATKQLVALSATKSLYEWSGRLSSGEIVGPGTKSLESRAFYTLIQDGTEATYWDVPQAFTFEAVRTGPRALRLLGIDSAPESGDIIETHVLDVKKKTTRDVLSTTFGLAKAIAPSDGALIIVDEAATVGGWPGATARGHFASPTSFTFETFARDGQLQEFEGLRKYPDTDPPGVVTPPPGNLGVFAYHVVRTSDLAPRLPTLPKTP